MSEYEEILDLQTNKAKPVIVRDIRKIPKRESDFHSRKRIQNFILYVVDSLISLMFVAPMVVSFWHGTWMLLDTYKHFFPPYATGVLGIAMHMCFVLMRQFIQDYFDEETARAKKNPVFVVARRLYTYLYSCASVMQWRGCWTAFDHLFVEGKGENLGWVVIATLLSITTLIGFKSLTNSLATPCILILDSLDACYNIPTRYRVMIILLLAFSSSKQNVIQIPAPKMNELFSEVISYNAHPFENKFRGSVPSTFTTTIAARGISHSTPIPKNIQDVIRNSEYEDETPTTVEILAQQSHNRHSTPVTTPSATYTRDQRQHDPFHAFKPHDISEVNLLAVNNVRFAPPPWIDLDNEKRTKERLLKRTQRNLANDKGKYFIYRRDADSNKKRYYLNVREDH